MRGKRKIDFINERGDIKAFLKGTKNALRAKTLIDRQYKNSLFADTQQKNDKLKEMKQNYDAQIHSLDEELSNLPRTEENAEKRTALETEKIELQKNYTLNTKAVTNEPTQIELDGYKNTKAIVNMGSTSKVFSMVGLRFDEEPTKDENGQWILSKEDYNLLNMAYHTIKSSGDTIVKDYETRYLYHIVAFRGYAALLKSLEPFKKPDYEEKTKTDIMIQEEIDKTLACYKENMIANGVNPNLIDTFNETRTKNVDEHFAKFETLLCNYFAEEAEKKFEEYVSTKFKQSFPDFIVNIETEKAQRLDKLRQILNPESILYIPTMHSHQFGSSSFGQILIDSGDKLFENQPTGHLYDMSIDKDFEKTQSIEEIIERYDRAWEKYKADHIPPIATIVPDPKPEPPIEFFDPPATYYRTEEGFMEKLPYPDSFFGKVSFFFSRVFGAESEADKLNKETRSRIDARTARINQKQTKFNEECKKAKKAYEEELALYSREMEQAKKTIYEPVESLLNISPEEAEKELQKYYEKMNSNAFPTKDDLNFGIQSSKSFYFTESEKETDMLAQSLENELISTNITSTDEKPVLNEQPQIQWNVLD